MVLDVALTMASFNHAQYEQLERAILDGSRVVFRRRGIEYVVVPDRLRFLHGRETIEARRPYTGDEINFFLDEIDSFEVVR
jgi:hypothetical protein